jgi:hypothetical protein
MPLTAQQKRDLSALWAEVNFVGLNGSLNIPGTKSVAIYNLDDLAAAAGAIDNAFDTTLNAAVAAVGGTTTVINGLASVIPAPVSGATAQQKTMIACYVLMKRVGII